MAIRILDTPEPLSAASFGQNHPTDLVSSSAGRLLLQELRRYCAREVKGRSFLIAGHRGAGKSTLVEDTVLTALKEAQRTGIGLRPLLVPLDGPSLFPSWAPEPVAAPPVAAPAPAAGGEAAAGAAKPAAEAAAAAAPMPATAPAPGTAAETLAALEQLTLGLHRALAREITQSFRQRVMEKASAGPRRDELLEVVAQLEMELYQCPSPARLREFWMLGGFLADGVLFPASAPNPFADLGTSMAGQGLRELTAVAGMAEAYCRIAGKYTQTDSGKTASAESLSSSASLELGKEFFTPFASLVAGLGVGASVLAANHDPLGAAAAGIVAALGSGLLFKTAWSRTQDRTSSRENSFIFDFTVATLDRVLPILIERLLNAGLAPVFVVDELDKVDNLSVRIRGMVHHLKKFVAENAFFCFLADRTYYEEMIRGSASEAYPVEYTYYSHRQFIVFGHADLHQFVARRLSVPRPEAGRMIGGARTTAPLPAPAPQAGTGTGEAYEQVKAAAEDADDADVLPFVLLHRSRMHPVDLRRELATRRSPDGESTLPPGALRTEAAYRQDLTVQIAVEIVLDRRDMRARMEREPEFRRLAHDALYYLSRRWEDEREICLDDGDGFDAFVAYLELRADKDARRPAPGAPPPVPRPVASQEEYWYLYRAVRDLAVLLSQPGAFAFAFENAWVGYRGADENAKIKATLRETLRLGSGQAAVLVGDEAWRYRWCFTPAGGEYYERGVPQAALAELAAAPVSSLAPPSPADAAAAPAADWEDEVRFIDRFAAFLASIGGNGGGQAAIDFSSLSSHTRVIDSSPAWPTVRMAIDRLKAWRLSNAPEYPDFPADVAAVRDFAALVERGAPLVGDALVCASVAGAFMAGTRADRIAAGLVAISDAYRFAQRSQDEVGKDLRALRTALRKRKYLNARGDAVRPLKGRSDLDAWLKALDAVLAVLPHLEQLDQGAVRAVAERSLGHRLQAFVTTGAGRADFEVEELFAVAARWSGWTGFDLSGVSLTGWSRLLVTSLEEWTSSPKGWPWVAVSAANVLGFAVPPEGLKEWMLTRGVTPGTVSEPSPYGFPPVWASGRGVLVIRRESESLVERWPVDRRVAALALTDGEIRRLATLWHDAGGQLSITPRLDLVAVEMPYEGGDEEAVLTAVASRLKNKTIQGLARLYVYPSSPTDPVRTPFQVAPRSAADLQPPLQQQAV